MRTCGTSVIKWHFIGLWGLMFVVCVFPKTWQGDYFAPSFFYFGVPIENCCDVDFSHLDPGPCVWTNQSLLFKFGASSHQLIYYII